MHRVDIFCCNLCRSGLFESERDIFLFQDGSDTLRAGGKDCRILFYVGLIEFMHFVNLLREVSEPLWLSSSNLIYIRANKTDPCVETWSTPSPYVINTIHRLDNHRFSFFESQTF